MSRQPVNVHVQLYRKNNKGEYEYAIFQRADNPLWWQGVSGGLEEGESPEEAALRESFEEAGTLKDSTIYPLETVSYLPKNLFSSLDLWSEDIIVLPMYFFALPVDIDFIISLSNEHTAVRWLEYYEAEALTYFHDQKTALWELNERLLKEKLLHQKVINDTIPIK